MGQIVKFTVADIEPAKASGDSYAGPDTYAGGFIKSASETYEGVKRGMVKGLLDLPRALVMAPYEVPASLIRTAQHPVDAARSVATAASDPEQGGALIAQLGASLIAPRVMPEGLPSISMPNARRAVGVLANGVERGPVKAAAKVVREWAEAPAAKPAPAAAPPAKPAATSPGGTPTVAAAPPTPAPAAPAAAPTVPPKVGEALKILLTEGGLRPDEANLALKLMNQGMPLEQVQARIQADRALRASGAFGKLPTQAEVDASVADRNAKGRWPQD